MIHFMELTKEEAINSPLGNTTSEEKYEVDRLNILDGSSLVFTQEKSGFLTLEYNGKTYHRVNLTRLIPFITKTEYISVSYENEEKEYIEIGVIKNINDLPEQNRNIVSEFLSFKYYMPEITKIYNIRDNMMGSIFVKVDCTAGKKTLCIVDWYSNFKLIGSTPYLHVVDADGNKYFCPDIYKLDKASRNNLEMYI